MAAHDVLFQPLKIKNVTIPNRFVSTSHQPGYTANGQITERGLRYEVEKAKGGVGLVQFGGATTVSVENCYYLRPARWYYRRHHPRYSTGG